MVKIISNKALRTFGAKHPQSDESLLHFYFIIENSVTV